MIGLAVLAIVLLVLYAQYCNSPKPSSEAPEHTAATGTAVAAVPASPTEPAAGVASPAAGVEAPAAAAAVGAGGAEGAKTDGAGASVSPMAWYSTFVWRRSSSDVVQMMAGECEEGSSHYWIRNAVELSRPTASDIAFLHVLSNFGGSASFSDIVAVQRGASGTMVVASVALDEVAIKSLRLDADILVVEILDYRPGDAHCCPSLPRINRYQLDFSKDQAALHLLTTTKSNPQPSPGRREAAQAPGIRRDGRSNSEIQRQPQEASSQTRAERHKKWLARFGGDYRALGHGLLIAGAAAQLSKDEKGAKEIQAEMEFVIRDDSISITDKGAFYQGAQAAHDQLQ